jgi:hypothetical protein
MIHAAIAARHFIKAVTIGSALSCEGLALPLKKIASSFRPE